jgi:mono/diheme cytochrome c family protein
VASKNRAYSEVKEFGEGVKASVFVYGFLVVLFFGGYNWAVGGETDQGKQFYLQYCSSCHGKEGRGNGPVSSQLKVKLPDLTLLKKNNKGLYPTDHVMSSIDGRRSVRGHGDREMPVWGEVFRKQTEEQRYSELTSLFKARAIAEYIATLQK